MKVLSLFSFFKIATQSGQGTKVIEKTNAQTLRSYCNIDNKSKPRYTTLLTTD